MGNTRRNYTVYTPDALRAILHEQALQNGSPVDVDVQFASMPPDAVDIRFLPGLRLRFVVPEAHDGPDRRDFFTNHWVATWPLFAGVKETYRSLTGECRLWTDDVAKGAGLAFCGNGTGHFLIPDSVYLETDGYEGLRAHCKRHAPAWAERRDVLFWRGATTGVAAWLRLGDWRDLPRIRLATLARQLERADLFDIALSRIVQIGDPGEVAGIRARGIVDEQVPLVDFMAFKYTVDIDGNSCSWPGLFTKLVMGTAVVKVASPVGFRQWYYDRLIPWKNFIPMSDSLAELVELAEWMRAHDREVEAIAARGRTLSDELSLEPVMRETIARIYNYVAR